MLRFYINGGEGEVDYSRYVVEGSVTINRQAAAAATCQLTLANLDLNFDLPVSRSYIRIYSEKYQKTLYSGFLQNDPTTSFIGVGKTFLGTQAFNFQMNFVSDEYLLNIKAVPLIPAFVNQSQGAILRTIADSLCPGFFDYTHCVSGDIVPYMAYDPTKTWSQIAQGFCQQSNMRYSVVDREIHFQPVGDAPLGIKYDENAGQGTFDPSQLSTSAQTTQVCNDATMIGQQEAGNNHDDFFIGDGFTGAFPLKHKVFGLADAESGNGLLLSDSWNETSLNTQNWTAQDPGNNFYYGAQNSQALNILTPVPNPGGTSFISATNGLELAGGVNMQHGEFVFNDVSAGVIGGVFDSQILNGYGDLAINEASLEAGFLVQPSATVNVTASGASGILISPCRQSSSVGISGAFQVVSKVNKSYVLNTNITVPAATRINQIFRTIAGVAYTSTIDQTELLGAITWQVIETDLFTGVQTFYNYTASGQLLPASALYVLVDNEQLNVTITTTQIQVPIPGSLNVRCEIGSGQLAPIYISGNVQYTGAFVTPSGGNLPIPISGIGPENIFALGTGLGQQAGEIDSGTATDTMNFYGDDLPGVGVRIRLQSFESQAAIARVQDPVSIAYESAVVGDDGLRSAVVNNLSPLPRTSEDCEAAAQAYIADRVKPYYQGTYNASSLFFAQNSDDIDFYPIPGRYLFVDCPGRNISKQNFVVTQVATSVVSVSDEVMSHNLTFGPRLQLNDLMARLVPQYQNLLYATDTAIAPLPQALESIGSNYLPDVRQTSIVTSLISGSQIRIDFLDALPINTVYEVRSADLNWGYADSRLVARIAATGSQIFPRSGYDQNWYIRFVDPLSGPPYTSSRRTKVIRVRYPQVPATPVLQIAQSDRLQYDFNGDVRDIEGIELRDGTGTQVFYQSIVGSGQDMNFDLTDLRGQRSVSTITGQFNLGKYLTELVPANQRSFEAYFFNLMWEYGGGVAADIPVPSAPVLTIGYSYAGSLQIMIADPTQPPRGDLKSTELQIASDPSFGPQFMIIDTVSVGNPGTLVNTVPISGTLYARAQFSDFIGSGAWSSTLTIPLGTLISSTYLVGQGSVPPSITLADDTGGLFTYVGAYDSLTLVSAPFSIVWPDGTVDTIPQTIETFTQTVDTYIRAGKVTHLQPAPLQPNTDYGFFPSVINPATANPSLEWNGPFASYATQTVFALTGQYTDGSVPMTQGAFVCQTAIEITGQSGGGGGGTYGGAGNCGVVSSLITMADGKRKTLAELCVGEMVRTRSGCARVARKTTLTADTYILTLSNGLVTVVGEAHTLFNEVWTAVAELETDFRADKRPYVQTLHGDAEITHASLYHPDKIVKLELEGLGPPNDEDHVYLLDDIWTHNTLVKVDAN